MQREGFPHPRPVSSPLLPLTLHQASVPPLSTVLLAQRFLLFPSKSPPTCQVREALGPLNTPSLSLTAATKSPRGGHGAPEQAGLKGCQGVRCWPATPEERQPPSSSVRGKL